MTPAATPNRGRVVLVAYDNDVHVYDATDADTAKIVYTVAVGANLDAEHLTLSAAAWDAAHHILREDHTIHDHRNSGRSTAASRAFNDPTVDCCDRDAADCDCPTSDADMT